MKQSRIRCGDDNIVAVPAT